MKDIFLFLLVFCGCGISFLDAQTVNNELFVVENAHATRQGDSVVVNFSVIVPRKAVKSNHMLQLTPELVSNSNACKLPELEIAGRSRYFYNQRNEELAEISGEGVSVRNRRRKEQVVNYSATIPYSSWMAYSRLVLVNEECGCRNVVMSNESNEAGMFEFPVSEIPLRYIFIYDRKRPSKECIEVANIIFPVNSTQIKENIADNKKELERIGATLANAQGEDSTVIVNILLKGYCSPEGGYKYNSQLAKKRVEAVRDYVVQQTTLPESIFTLESVPENWAGLEKFLQTSNYENKTELLAIVCADVKPDERERMLKQLDGGASYRRLLKDVFPGLRLTEYSITSRVQGVDMQEANGLLKTAPDKLTMDQIAALMGEQAEGDQAFRAIVMQGVKNFPNNEEMNINAANVALSMGQLDDATRYLQKAGNSAEAIATRGALALRRGDLFAANELLTQAVGMGNKVAQYNLDLLNEMTN